MKNSRLIFFNDPNNKCLVSKETPQNGKMGFVQEFVKVVKFEMLQNVTRTL